ncbi:MAG: regulatory signaling modulator protein AmpE [Sulfuriflexus sp.]|nr:regulatory signaling modulator protein AmpE [Sulfuriflexus sp.]
MSLIAILISLILERSFQSFQEYRQFAWFDKLTDRAKKWCDERNWQGPTVILLIMVGPLLAVILINSLLDGVALGLFSLIFSTAVLFLCLGPLDLDKQVETFLAAWDTEDEETARAAAKELLGETPPESLSELQQQLMERILVAASERILSPIIWFTVFAMLGSGPLGVVLYRLSCHLHQRVAGQADGFATAVNRLYAILGWVPAHVVALLFAMAGSFVDTIQLWRERSSTWRDDWQQAASMAVVTGGFGALQMSVNSAEVTNEEIPQHVRAALGLILRSIVILVVLIAVITLTIFRS